MFWKRKPTKSRTNLERHVCQTSKPCSDTVLWLRRAQKFGRLFRAKCYGLVACSPKIVACKIVACVGKHGEEFGGLGQPSGRLVTRIASSGGSSGTNDRDVP